MTQNQIAYRNSLAVAEQAEAAKKTADAATMNAATTRSSEDRGFWSSLGSTIAGIGVALLGILL